MNWSYSKIQPFKSNKLGSFNGFSRLIQGNRSISNGTVSLALAAPGSTSYGE